jgi:hypothetical protein
LISFFVNALISVLRDLPSTTAILIRTLMERLATVPVGEMMEHCPQLNFLRIHYDGSNHSGYGMGDLVKSLNKLPALESLQFISVPLYQRNALLLSHNLMKIKLVRSILMVDSQIDNFLASMMVSVLKDNPKRDNLEFICFFIVMDIMPHRGSGKRTLISKNWQKWRMLTIPENP